MNQYNMPKSFLSSALLLMLYLSAPAQQYYDIADFLKLAGSSTMHYNYEALKSPVKSTHDASRINFSTSRLVDSMGIRMVVPFDILPDVKELYDLGWESVDIGEPDSAVVIFSEALKLDSFFSPAYTGMGYAFNLLGKPDAAKEACKRAIALNPIDYIAWWTLATSWDKMNMPDSAIQAICHAWILNRNHPEIMKDVKRFAEKGGLVLDNWVFNPQYSVDQADDQINIAYWKPWMGYAICKTFWSHEPGFELQRKMTGDAAYFQERECLSCLLTSMGTFSTEADADSGLQGFKRAMQQKMASDFILFEIFLPENPDISYYMDQDRINQLIRYIISQKLK
jgi:tetratricopeptide (TPR) repeat protein